MSKLAEATQGNKRQAEPGRVRQTLHELAREGARQMLQQALLCEVQEHMQQHQRLRDEQGHAVVVRNGYARPRKLMMGMGPVEVIAPRVDDRGLRPEQRFASAILPRYSRRAAEVSEALPELYLRGLSSGDFQASLKALMGEEAAGLSASVVTRLTGQWTQQYEAFRKKRYEEQQYVYLWVDGVHLNIRLEEDRLSLLVVIGVRVDGTKELLALEDGYRESTESWLSVLRALRDRGLAAPVLAIGDGALGFWAAVRQVYPSTRGQRCWVHKMCNVLDKLPKRLQGRAREHLRRMMYAESRKECEREKEAFEKEYQKYGKAVESLQTDWESLLTYYDYPLEHWKHLRTTNPIESPFATLRHRQRRTKGNGSRRAGLAMAYKLLDNAQRRWRKLDWAVLLIGVAKGVRFQDGLPKCSEEVLALRRHQADLSTPSQKEAPAQTTH